MPCPIAEAVSYLAEATHSRFKAPRGNSTIK